MNRTLYSIQYIKFNQLRNHLLAASSKKKWTLNKSKQQSQIIVRKFTSYTNGNKPPNNYWEIFIIACGITILQNIRNSPTDGSSGLQCYQF